MTIKYSLFSLFSFHEDITLNNGQAKVIQQRIMKNGVIYQIDGVLTIPTDLKDNTMVDVAQDLGCNILLDYLYRGWIYDYLRGDCTYAEHFFYHFRVLIVYQAALLTCEKHSICNNIPVTVL